MTTPDNHDDDRQAELTAYLDGELDEHATQALEEQLSRDAKLRARVDALRKTWELLDFLPQPEPSPAFTSRTLERLEVPRPAAAAVAPKPATAGTPPVAPRPWRRSLVWLTAAAALFVAAFTGAGLGGRKPARSDDPRVVEEEMAKDYTVLEHLTLYQYADDLAFLYALDQPDLFGDEAGH